jgi:hypothetical protein
MGTDEPSPIRIVIIEAQSEAVLSTVLCELGGIERVYIGRIDHMGDKNYVSGQAGAVGSNSRSKDDSFIQIPAQSVDATDLVRLAAQLEIVRTVMKQQSGLTPTAEQDDEIGHVARAQIAAKEGDEGGVMAHLKQAGAWTLKVAKDTGAEIVASFLAHLVKG